MAEEDNNSKNKMEEETALSIDVAINNEAGQNDDPRNINKEQEIGDDPVNVKNQTLIKVSRPIYTQAQFDQGYEAHKRHTKTIRERFTNIAHRCTCRNVLFKIFPFLKILRGYTLKDDFVSDLISGLTVGVMHIPQGMAYGMLANLPPVYGLYVSFFPVIIYFFFGTSRHISLGTFAVVSLMTGQVVDKSDCEQLYGGNSSSYSTVLPQGGYAATTQASIYSSTQSPGLDNSSIMSTSSPSADDSAVLMCKIGVATGVAFLAGVLQLLLGVLRMGFVTIYLSEPLTRGFTTAAAVYVITSQIKHVFGITTDKFTGPLALVYTYIDLFSKITTTNVASLIMGIICMIIIWCVKEYLNPKVKAKIKMPFPIELVMVILGTLVSFLAKMEWRFGMKVVGEIPQGLPAPVPPPFNKFGMLIKDAVGISIVAFADNFAMAKLFSRKQVYNLDSNQELVAYGITNIGSSFFGCYTNAASLSRSLIQEAVGGKTQIAGLVSCCFLLIIFYGVGPLFEQLPNCVLASIVIVNLKGMFLQFKDLKKLWRISKYDMAIWLVIFFSVCLLDVDVGLFVGVIFGLLTVVFRTQTPYNCVLGRVPHTDIYKDITVYQQANEVPGLKIFRFESSLYYANSEHFIEKLFHKSGVNPRKLRAKQMKVQKKKQKDEEKRDKELRKRSVKANGIPESADKAQSLSVDIDKAQTQQQYTLPQAPVTHIIIDCSTMSYIDAVGISTLAQVIDEYKMAGVVVFLAGCKAGIRQQLRKADFFEKMQDDHLFLSVHDAVLAAFHTDDRLQKQIRECPSPVIRAESVFQLTEMNSRQNAHNSPLLSSIET